MADPARDSPGLSITVVFSAAPGVVREWVLQVPEGATVADALRASAEKIGAPQGGQAICGVWGRVVEPGQLLRDNDRVEVYRPLTVDPKVARRERFARQGARTTGLFASRRPGGKAGY